jgi:uncharacterized protein YukE
MSAIIPEVYNTVKITVSPTVLSESYTNINNLLNQIVDQLNTIMTTMENLQLSWVGQSSSLANQFTQQWNQAAKSLFGTQNNPEEGVLNRVAEGLQEASSNYCLVEQWAQSSFGQLVSGLSSSNSSSSDNPQSVVNSPGNFVTAITETF